MTHDRDDAKQRYPHVLRAIQETPWAIREEAFDVLVEIVSARADGHTFTAEEIEARIGGPPQGGRVASYAAGSVTVIPLFGMIFPRANVMTAMSGATSLQQFEASLDDALEDRGTDAILIDVDSPGGTIDLVPEVAATIRGARGEKPLWAIANTHADSAAYWLASQAERLLVTPSGEVGSIGIFAAHQDRSGEQERVGVSTTLISAGRRKTERSPFAPLSEEARAEIQARVDEHYTMFVDDVARGRGVTAATVRSEAWGEGLSVSAKRAVAAGMADEVATFKQALTQLSKRPARRTRSPGASHADVLAREHARFELRRHL